MNWDALGAIAELLGAIAVFLTLAYLTVQVRQNSKALELQNQFSAAQIMQARTDTVMAFCGAVASEPDLLAAAEVAIENPDSLDPSKMTGLERNRYLLLLGMARSMLENSYQQTKQGFLSADFYEGSVIRNIAIYGPAFLKFNTPMSAEFRSEVERVVAMS